MSTSNSNKRSARDEARFWSSVEKGCPLDCWEWRGWTDKDGYGRFSIRGRKYGAHRVAFELTYGYRPPVVMHRCDNPACCNPSHLAGGTQRDNVADRDRKDRQAKGSRNGRSKLTEEQVRRIKRELRRGEMPQAELARRHGVHNTVIRDIERGKTWGHVRVPREGSWRKKAT